MPPYLRSTATYFVSTATHDRRPHFRTEAYCELFLETLQHYRREGHYRLHAFVVMPDHIHLLLTPNELTIERVMGFIKGGFSHKIPAIKPFWQKGYHDRLIRDAEEFISRKAYIHDNPVRARLAGSPFAYRFSSAFGKGPAAAEAASPDWPQSHG